MKNRPRASRNHHVIRYSDPRLNAINSRSNGQHEDDSIFGHSFGQVRKSVRRVSIATKMDQKSRSYSRQCGTSATESKKTDLSMTRDFKQLRKIYLKQQMEVQKLVAMEPKSKTLYVPNIQCQSQTAIKEGLLGQRKHYQKMEKNELIDKLIALEFLAKKLYKQNRALMQKLNPDLN